MARKIEKAAVLGSGVMGGAIAAHLANAGIPSIVLDILPKETTPEEEAKGLTLESPEVRNRIVNGAVQAALKTKPDPFFHKKLAGLITTGNFEDHWDRIRDADWIIEVVKEDLEIKKKVLARAAEYRGEDAVVSTNTSGLSVAAMCEGLDESFRKHFLCTHFFNPPRYLHLLEIVPGPDTDPRIVQEMAEFVDLRLGKGVVLARDTPNFVANRVGVFGLLDAIRAMEELGLTVEEVDALTGPLTGRPKSASFRTADLVGLDTFVAVSRNVYERCPDDESRDLFTTPPVLERMLEKKLLGGKTGGGFYKKSRGKDGKKEILTLDLATLEYRPRIQPKFPEVDAIRDRPLAERMAALAFGKGKGAEFTWRTLNRFLLYCACRVGEICDTVRPIDDGMRWGFGWKKGPFEIWDLLGVAKVAERMEADGLELPSWVRKLLERDDPRFYTLEDGAVGTWDPAAGSYREEPFEPSKIKLTLLKKAGAERLGNSGASLVDLGDGVACFEFHSRMNALGGDIIGLVRKVHAEVEKNFDGLVIGNQGSNFSVGANLMMILMEAQEQNWEELDLMVRAFQQATMSMKYAKKPVVVAPFGMALGGGAEFTLHGQRVRASAETYIGLVEVGAGVVPAGGGTKELYLRNLERWTGTEGLLTPLQKTFETIGMAKVATSAVEGKELGFLRDSDRITMNPDRLIGDAKETVLSMVREGYRPGAPRTDIPVMGRAGKAALEIGLFNMEEGGFISAYDRKIGGKLAHILCGGDLTGTRLVSEQYLLDLEREAFLRLLGERKTLERIQALLKTGKPLRN